MLCVRPAGCYQTVPSVLMLGGDEFHTALQRPAGEMCIFSAGGPHLGHRPKWQLSRGTAHGAVFDPCWSRKAEASGIGHLPCIMPDT